MKPKMIPVAELVFDYGLYPRQQIDSAHVRNIRLARQAGVELPPITIDQVSKRIVDGFHRAKDILLEDPKGKIACTEKKYTTEAEMFLDAMRLNASHGSNLTVCDRLHCILLAERLQIDEEAVADALGMTEERIGELRLDRTAKSNGTSLALKQTIRHMRGKRLSESQWAANKKLSGMRPAFYVNQLLLLLENDLLDDEDEKLGELLDRLAEKLAERVKT